MRRAFDFSVSLVLLVLLAPLLAVTAVMVKFSSRGPVFYRAERVGLGGKTFRMLKFRTMVVGADRTGPGITIVGDPRVTRVGRFLRAMKLDELPQLVNVLKGDLALIGPRAESPEFVAHYTSEQRRVLTVRPGVTGPGQLHYTTDQQGRVVDLAEAEEVYVHDLLADKLRMDLDYVENRGIRRDVRILLRTVWVVGATLVRGAARVGRRRFKKARANAAGAGTAPRR